MIPSDPDPATAPGDGDGPAGPESAGKLFAQAVQHHRAGRLAAAEQAYRRVLAIRPGHADCLHMLGGLAQRTGRPEAAMVLIGQAIALRDEGAYHHSLGNVLVDLGRLDEAAAQYQRTLALDPGSAEAHNNLGFVRHVGGQQDEARACFERAVALQPAFAEAHINLGTALRALGRFDQAAACYRRALALKPDDAQACNNLGSVLADQGRLADAAVQYRRALALKPVFAEAHNNLGTVCHRQGRLADAAASYRRALELAPAFAEAHANLATVFRDQGRLGDAAAGYRRALELAPAFAEARAKLGTVLKEQGRLDEALLQLRAALALKPDSAWLHSGLVMASSYSPDIDEAGLAAICRDWGRRHGQLHDARHDTGTPRHRNRPEPERRLRVGYVSGDFRQHPVGWFLDRVWPAHDPAELVIHAYSGVVVEDALTGRLRRSAAGWHDTTALNDAALAERIRGDGIDVLVDLDGHTERNRLTMFARRPAPVQLAWLGHGHTTGLAAIDAVLMDEATVPAGSAPSGFVEELVRLPGGRLCYAPPDYAPPVAPPPCRQRGRVTFGSFNNLAKVTPAVLGLWARVLAAVPGASLSLRWKSLADGEERTRLRLAFSAAGGDGDRLELLPALPHPALLAAYGEIDIALDPFPFGGGLTSCEALWMGVPVLTWPGVRPMSRQTLGFLAALGLTRELAADSAEAYVDLAAGLAAAPERLAALRVDLRPRMAASPLCDGPRQARALEAVYRHYWRRCVASL